MKNKVMDALEQAHFIMSKYQESLGSTPLTDEEHASFYNIEKVLDELKTDITEKELVNEIEQLILHAEEDSLTYSVLEHARKLVFTYNHPDDYAKYTNANVL